VRFAIDSRFRSIDAQACMCGRDEGDVVIRICNRPSRAPTDDTTIERCHGGPTLMARIGACIVASGGTRMLRSSAIKGL